MPLGLIGTYVGGTPIEDWTPPTGVLYNAMVAPLTGLAIKAILWYVPALYVARSHNLHRHRQSMM